ncbi:EG45-like domain containing protein [Dendrobium catenatum]|uniref:EG45-like domain containing protein n=1 Tax=Dendrobium catenatum TaxID=906689 RepID=A0A2I0VVN4_9ASPA|nr:EG45-like domain containing protein [Dendrobium catenatum]
MLMFLSLASIASALRIGVSSYYIQPYFPSACFGDQKNGVYLASVNDELWDGGNICGQYYQVYCPNALNSGEQQPCSKIGDTIGALVTVVDHCNDCGGATMLLSQEIFQMIANIDVGRIQLNYKKFQPYD